MGAFDLSTGQKFYQELEVRKLFMEVNCEVREHMMAMHPMGRLGKPQEILWLCSEGARDLLPDIP